MNINEKIANAAYQAGSRQAYFDFVKSAAGGVIFDNAEARKEYEGAGGAHPAYDKGTVSAGKQDNSLFDNMKSISKKAPAPAPASSGRPSTRSRVLSDAGMNNTTGKISR